VISAPRCWPIRFTWIMRALLRRGATRPVEDVR
jgi:hypothetical protein